MKDEKIVVIGGGFGGLSAACFLGKKGFEVELVEKNDSVGGRASVLEEDGYRFDMGPSWYLMPDIFERFFNRFDRDPEDFYSLTRLDPNYSIFFKDGDRMDVPADPEEASELFETYEDGAGEAFQRYLEKSEETYDIGMNEFVLKDRNNFRDYISLDVLRNARGISLIKKMQDHVEEYFDNPKLQQVMQYTLVFLGGSPENTPALYNLMSHVDFNMGVYYPEGGIYSVIEGMKELAEEQGVKFSTGEEVRKIDRRDGKNFVETEDREIEADAVVSNADYAFTETELLPEKFTTYDKDYWDSRTYAPSAFLMYLGVEGELEELEHHSLVLPEDWNPHFEKIFDDPGLPEDPAYYVCNPSDTDETVAPEGKSALFILVPVAAELDLDEDKREKFREAVLEDLAENTGEDLRGRINYEKIFAGEEFKEKYNSYNGTALGIAHTLRQTSVFRPKQRSKNMKGLYYTGQYTNPGIGMPMCLISGEHVAEKVVEDLEDEK
ncbi:phytoene desaturase family protein [Candidatus Nanosalina sp. VS9-1]|uniref:phytoene desaturase family protein n=1 Tax=Candidatus Nanosalina sp. VS9-1 TaxID=3388566 RepID=UPI0039E0071B